SNIAPTCSRRPASIGWCSISKPYSKALWRGPSAVSPNCRCSPPPNYTSSWSRGTLHGASIRTACLCISSSKPRRSAPPTRWRSSTAGRPTTNDRRQADKQTSRQADSDQTTDQQPTTADKQTSRQADKEREQSAICNL